MRHMCPLNEVSFRLKGMSSKVALSVCNTMQGLLQLTKEQFQDLEMLRRIYLVCRSSLAKERKMLVHQAVKSMSHAEETVPLPGDTRVRLTPNCLASQPIHLSVCHPAHPVVCLSICLSCCPPGSETNKSCIGSCAPCQATPGLVMFSFLVVLSTQLPFVS